MALVTDKTLFIHLPKTGGSTVRAVINASVKYTRESGPFFIHDHYGLPEVLADCGGFDLGRRMSFSFVRNPVDWIKSRWAWGVVSGFDVKRLRVPKAAAHWMADCWSEDCQEFVVKYLARHPGVYTRMVFSKLGIWTGNPVQMIGNTENLLNDLFAILETAGQPFDVEKARVVANEKVAAKGKLAAACQLPKSLEQSVMIAEGEFCHRFGY